MPLPKPNTGESESEFIDRCMANPVMNDEYPDASQRAAVCHSQYRGRSMHHVRIKSVEGKWEDKDMESAELEAWFRENTKDGAVTSEITMFADAQFKAVEEDGVQWVLSDMSLDRDMERIDPTGADFRNYKKNPVVLWAHDYTRPAIGKLQNPKVKDGVVVGKVVFDSKDNDPFAYMIGQKVKAGIISSGSVGFKPTNVEFVEDSKDPTRLIHRKWELLEFSVCNVPANFNALAQREADVEDTKVTDKDKMELADAISKLAAKIDALDAEIKVAQKNRQSYIDAIMRDRDETSPVDKQEHVDDDTIDGLFVASETNAPAVEKPEMFGL